MNTQPPSFPFAINTSSFRPPFPSFDNKRALSPPLRIVTRSSKLSFRRDCDNSSQSLRKEGVPLFSRTSILNKVTLFFQLFFPSGEELIFAENEVFSNP